MQHIFQKNSNCIQTPLPSTSNYQILSHDGEVNDLCFIYGFTVVQASPLFGKKLSEHPPYEISIKIPEVFRCGIFKVFFFFLISFFLFCSLIITEGFKHNTT